ncbi:MAG: 4-hydroxybenzoyl-CoA thioesterase [Pirellulaceae bacterium]|nr:MAG: 4-hydroxybenzoyl-CoA thioesterase [Pirellulaceae bacterium]GIW93053.1 MAG: 4-hydroxybenzoyl-CoA thioesterase [Pirellulaceae bacterium]
MSTFHTTRRVEFRDTDAAGIMHFSAFFTKMEEAEHELLRSIGQSVYSRSKDGRLISWPRVAAECRYRGPAHFEDILDIAVHLERMGTSSVTFAFTFHRGDDLIAEGRITTVCCRLVEGSKPEPIPIPPEIREQLQRYLVVA